MEHLKPRQKSLKGTKVIASGETRRNIAKRLPVPERDEQTHDMDQFVPFRDDRAPCTYRRDSPDAIASVPFRDKKVG